jgi:hypothetical protein
MDWTLTVLRITPVQHTQAPVESEPTAVWLSNPLHSVHPAPYSLSMDLSSLSTQQLKELVRGLVDDRIRELIGDPDLGLQLGDSLRTRLKQSLAGGDRLSGEDVAERLGLRW